MIEAEITITCEGCMAEETLHSDELMEIANFSNSMVACWGLEDMPAGWTKQDDETYCEKCRTKYYGAV